MAITQTSTNRSHGTNGVATNNIARTQTLTAGAAVRVLVACDTAVDHVSLSDGTTTYTSKGTSTALTFYGVTLHQFIMENVTGGSTTVTATFKNSSNVTINSNMQWIMLQEITGQDTTSYIDAKQNYQPNPSSTSTDGITTTAATIGTQPNLLSAIIIGASSPTGHASFTFDTFGADFPVAGVGYSGNWATQYKRTTSATNQASTWTNGNSGDYILSALMVFAEYVAPASTGHLDRNPLVYNPLLGVLA